MMYHNEVISSVEGKHGTPFSSIPAGFATFRVTVTRVVVCCREAMKPCD
jgi:hypothetical protein